MPDKRIGGAVSIIAPNGFADAFKRLAAERSAIVDPRRARQRVSVQEMHEEAVRDLLEQLAAGRPAHFVSTPFRRRQPRKAMWLDPALFAEVKRTAQRYDVAVATVVLTACLTYLEAHGVKLD
jgi:hypothetical protein